MKTLLKKIIRQIRLILAYIPTDLPVGVTEFHKYADDIIDLSGKYADSESMKFVIATNFMHLGPQKSKVSKQFFLKTLRKAAANQVAGHIFQDIKQKQAERIEAEKALVEKNEQKKSDI